MFDKYFYIDQSSPSGLRWICDRGNQVVKGDPAGSLNSKGYWVVELLGKGLVVHRVIAVMVGILTDYDSDLEIDHFDRNRSNNHLDNLRVVTRLINLSNKGLYKSNKTGVSGVSWCKDRPKLTVMIGHLGVRYNLGYFDNLLDAVAARFSKYNELKRI